jgi:superfamily II DNA/RNA helicase
MFAIIYGALPPETKLAQAANFNDPNNPVNVLIATDAVGMGLNLNIKRSVTIKCPEFCLLRLESFLTRLQGRPMVNLFKITMHCKLPVVLDVLEQYMTKAW